MKDFGQGSVVDFPLWAPMLEVLQLMTCGCMLALGRACIVSLMDTSVSQVLYCICRHVDWQ